MITFLIFYIYLIIPHLKNFFSLQLPVHIISPTVIFLNIISNSLYIPLINLLIAIISLIILYFVEKNNHHQKKLRLFNALNIITISFVLFYNISRFW